MRNTFLRADKICSTRQTHMGLDRIPVPAGLRQSLVVRSKLDVWV